MKKILILLIITLIFTGCSKANNNVNFYTPPSNVVEAEKISYEDTLIALNNGAILIDVRTLDEYNENHINKAISLPQENITEETAQTVIPTKETVVIVYCKSGRRSNQAAVKLQNLGYTNVYDFGSIENWQE